MVNVSELPRCPKCAHVSGDSWSQCGAACPMPGSPVYDAGLAASLPPQAPPGWRPVSHPLQPVALDKHGTPRFVENKIVRHLLDHATNGSGKCGLNELALMDFDTGDWEQFYQLIGYSVSAYGSLRFVRGHVRDRADLLAEELLRQQRKARGEEVDDTPY